MSQSDLSDGAFRLYYISRSMIWENAKGGPPPRPVVEITYEEYATILNRSARTISRLAQDLYALGLWEEVERTHRSVRVPGKGRPEVQTVVTVRVHDYPREPWAFDGPTKTWDVLSALREAKRRASHDAGCPEPNDGVCPGQCGTTDLSGQSDQGKHPRSDGTSEPDPATGRATTSTEADGEDVSAGQCEATDLSGQSDQAQPDTHACADPDDDPFAMPSPAQTPRPAGQCEATDLTEPRTNLSGDAEVSAGQTACQRPLKKKDEEEKPSLPPPSATHRESLSDELAMFSAPAIELVTQLYDKTLANPSLQPLSAADRAGLARRIDARLAEGWSVTRIRSVLTGGSLVGVKMPGRLWAGRLDDMPAAPHVPTPRNGDHDRRPASAGAARRSAERRERSVVTNDCSTLPDPNAGKARYEVPDDRGVRLTPRWADARRVLPWCGRCSSEARTLRPASAGTLPRPCPECHPEPHAFPAPAPQDDQPMATAANTDAG